MKTDELSKLIGYPVGREIKKMILMEVKETGLPIQAVADQYSIPPLFIKDKDGMIVFEGKKITPDEYQSLFPFKTVIIIEERK